MVNDNIIHISETQQQILSAAVEEFLDKGYNGSRMQSIADRSGINKALLHYYYRNKELLFNSVFSKVVIDLFFQLSSIIKEEMSLEVKLKTLFTYHMKYFLANPRLPLFLLKETYRNPDLVDQVFKEMDISSTWDAFIKGLNNRHQLEKRSNEELKQWMITVISLLVFPFASRHIIQQLSKMNDTMFENFMQQRVQIYSDFVIQEILKI